MKKIIKSLAVLGLLLLFAAPLRAAEFTADTRVIGAGKTADGKFYFAGDQWRVEEHLPKNEYRITIFRADKRSLYVLWPDKKRYFVQPLGEKEYQLIASRKPGEETERIELGQEEISGLPATKYQVTYKVQERVIKSIEWFSKDLGVVIKSHAEDNAWSTEMTNIKVEQGLKRELFEVPKDFKELSAKDVLTVPKNLKRGKDRSHDD